MTRTTTATVKCGQFKSIDADRIRLVLSDHKFGAHRIRPLCRNAAYSNRYNCIIGTFNAIIIDRSLSLTKLIFLLFFSRI